MPKAAEPIIPKPRFLKMPKRAFKIFRVLAGTSLAFRNELHLRFKIELACILPMRAVHDEAKCVNTFAFIDKLNFFHRLAVNQRHLLTRLQIAPRFFRA